MSRKYMLFTSVAILLGSIVILIGYYVDRSLTCIPTTDTEEITVYLEAYDQGAAFSSKGHAIEFLVLHLWKPQKARNCYELALHNFNQAIAIRPDHEGGYMVRAATLMNLEQYDKAIDDFHKVLEINPYDRHARLGIARAYERNGQLETAISQYEEALEFMESSAYWQQFHPDTIDKYRTRLDRLRRSVKE